MRTISLYYLLLSLPLLHGLHWGLVIDGGSTGSRIRIYSWNERSSKNIDPIITQFNPPLAVDQALLENTIPISSFTSNPDQAGLSLAGLIAQAARWVPDNLQSSTPLILHATAGMRLLTTDQQNAIFLSIRNFFHSSANPFLFQDKYASIASGEQEAVWAWVMANYLSGLLTKDTALPSQYISTIELGGASAQIDFIPTDELLGGQFDITVFGKTVSLYAHSFLRFGKDQYALRARRLAVSLQDPQGKGKTYPTVIHFPCFYNGYTDYWTDPDAPYNTLPYTFIGTGDWDHCYNDIVQVVMGLNMECLQPPCSFFGVYQPRLPVNHTFWGLSAYFYTLNGIGLVANNAEFIGTVKDIEPTGRAQCAKTWDKALADLPGSPPAFVAAYCLDATFMVALLRAQGAENIPISYARKKYGQTIGWPLGALIDALNLFPLDVSSTPTYVPSPSPSPSTASPDVYYSGPSFVQSRQNSKSHQDPMQPLHP